MSDVRRTGRLLVAILIAAFFGVGAATVVAQDTEAGEAEFVPRAGPPPAKRTGGGSRSCITDPDLFISVLAPQSVAGLTARARPTLYWYASKSTSFPVEMGITRIADNETVLEVTFDGIEKSGLQKLDLSQHDIKLEPGVEYEWAFQVIEGKQDNSRAANAACRIVRMTEDEAASLPDKLDEADPQARATAYGKEGVWFEYVAALLERVEEDPKDEARLKPLAAALKSQNLIWLTGGKIDEPSETKSEKEQAD